MQSEGQAAKRSTFTSRYDLTIGRDDRVVGKATRYGLGIGSRWRRELPQTSGRPWDPSSITHQVIPGTKTAWIVTLTSQPRVMSRL
jgi:hypothetical protein